MPEGYVSAGYLLTAWIDRPLFTARALPDRLLSLSGCLAPRLPDLWAIEWVRMALDERLEAAARLGIDPTRLPGVVQWVTARVGREIGWPSLCASLETGRALAALAGGALVLLGIGLANRHRDEALVVDAERPGEGPSGVLDALLRDEPLAPGGTPLGHELVSLHRGLSCSWLCNGLEREVPEALGFETNVYGLIEDCDDADRAAVHVNRPEVGAEPGLWLPWQLVYYPPAAAPGRAPPPRSR